MPATRHRFTVDDWVRIIAAGVFGDDRRLELLEGEIFEMTPIGPRHGSVVDRLARLWFARLGSRAVVRVRGPLQAGPASMPEPDVALLRETADSYRARYPGPDDVLLGVEVADASLEYDRAKLRIHAEAGVREAWIVDPRGDRVEACRAPVAGRYADRRVARRGESIACRAFPDLAVAVDDILGPPSPAPA